MIIQMIVIRQVSNIETTYWTTEAWDEYTLDENPQGFDEAIEKAQKTHGPDNVRVLKVKIPADALAFAFRVPVVDGEIDGA